MFDYLTGNSVFNLKEFTVGRIKYLGWESNLSIKSQKCCLHSFSEYKPVRETLLKVGIFNDFSQ